MNAILRKLAVFCLVLALTGAAWAGNCKGDSAGNGDNKKACEAKDKDGNGDKKADCDKGESKSCDKAADKAG